MHRRVVGIESGLRRIVAGIKKPVPDTEMKPNAARRVAIASGFERNAEHLGRAADWQRARLDFTGQALRHDLGGIDRRIAELGEERKTADVILVAVAEDQRVGRRCQSDFGQAARRRTFAEIEHEALALRLDGKAGRPLFADPGHKPQRWPMPVHVRLNSRFNSCSFGQSPCQD